MSGFETPPTPPPEPEKELTEAKQPEHEPVSYEKVLEAARALYEAKTNNPLVPEEGRTRQLQEVWDLKESWEAQGRSLKTPEGAMNAVRSATLWIDAGYSQPKFLREAKEDLTNEHAIALKEGNEEIIKILSDAIESIDNKLDSKERTPAKLKAYLDQVQQLTESGKNMEAVQMITSALFHSDFKPIFKKDPQRREEMLKLREEIKAKGMIFLSQQKREEKPE